MQTPDRGAATEHRAEMTWAYLWSDDATDYVKHEAVEIKWRFVGERKWRKKTVIADPERGQTALTLRGCVPEIVAKLAEREVASV